MQREPSSSSCQQHLSSLDIQTKHHFFWHVYYSAAITHKREGMDTNTIQEWLKDTS